MLKFEVGKTYRMLGVKTTGNFRAKCVRRTEKTATFEALDNGAVWYMPSFTLRATRDNGIIYYEDDPIEVFATAKAAHTFHHGVMAYACDEVETMRKRTDELRAKCESAVEQALS